MLRLNRLKASRKINSLPNRTPFNQHIATVFCLRSVQIFLSIFLQAQPISICSSYLYTGSFLNSITFEIRTRNLYSVNALCTYAKIITLCSGSSKLISYDKHIHCDICFDQVLPPILHRNCNALLKTRVSISVYHSLACLFIHIKSFSVMCSLYVRIILRFHPPLYRKQVLNWLSTRGIFY